MKVRWQDVKREIHDEVEKIWFDEPVEVTMSKLGVFPSGAGTDHQFLGNLFFLNADTQGMGWWTIEPAMYEILADQDFSLDHCKKLFHYMNAPMAHLMGDVKEPECPAPWMNLQKFPYFHDKIVASYDSIQTKEELIYYGHGSPMWIASTAGFTPFFLGNWVKTFSAKMWRMWRNWLISLVIN